MGVSFVDYRPLPRSNGGSQPNAQHLTTSGLSCEVTANRQALQALRYPRIAGCRNWINQLLPPGITCTLCRSSDSPQAARHHSTIVSFVTVCCWHWQIILVSRGINPTVSPPTNTVYTASVRGITVCATGRAAKKYVGMVALPALLRSPHLLTISRLFGHTIIRMHAITLVVSHQGATCN